MNTDITPALSAEEWAIIETDKDFATQDRAALLGRLSIAGRIAAYNALLPDDDPRKIRREHVDAIRAACTALDAEHGWPSGDADIVLPHLAAILDSILPP